MMASWEPLFKPHQHATDHSAVSAAIAALEGGDRDSAARSLEAVRSMEWGVYCSREAYVTILSQMMDCFMYWGDDFDQQQAYIDVHGIYTGLSDGTLSPANAQQLLRDIKRTQLLPLLEEDLAALQSAWSEAAATL